MLTDSSLSIVSDTRNPGRLMVRARAAGDIEKVFPNAIVTETPNGDYRWRTTLSRRIVSEALTAEIKKIGYPNFKAAVPNNARHDAYMRCWSAMRDFQRRLIDMGSLNVTRAYQKTRDEPAEALNNEIAEEP